MLDLKFVRANLGTVRAMLADRRMDLDLAPFEALDAERRRLLTESETLRHEQKTAGQTIAEAGRAGGDVSALKARMAEIKARTKDLEPLVKAKEEACEAFLLAIPNLLHESVPRGAGSEGNVEVRRWGTPRALDFPARDHVDVGEALGILDFARAAKLSGARFYVLRGAGAALERALVSFMLDVHVREHGYTEVLTPYLVGPDAMTGTGQLPKFESDLFRIAGRDLYLIPTAEVPVTNLHREETLAEADLPVRYVAFSPCFRSEAGSYGKDTRGLIRLHQFHKVELVRFEHPARSAEALEELTVHAATILERLGLPYRVVALCSGDLGFSAAKTYDLEVWLPGQNTYREISSCSNFSDFQARRARIRFKGKEGGYLHTLNGSGLAVGRTLVAILENYQEADGTVTVPEALRPYLGGLQRIEPR
jgi:seryl-tRNA synthetase